jgi:tetratricopeptide (TPR) repeat protein
LSEGRLDDAETGWRRLYEVAPDFAPTRSGQRGRSAKHYLSVSLYLKAMAALDVETASTILAEVSSIGALDKEVADALVRVHLQRFSHLCRRHDWQGAAREAGAAEAKLQHLEPLVSDPKEVATIRGCCHAAKGLLALRLERDRQAVEDFDKAIEAVKALRPKQVLGRSGNSLLEQLLNSLIEGQAEKDTIHPNFLRDTALLGGIAELHVLAGEPGTRGFADKAAHVRGRIEEALAADPSSAEAKALLGLLYYYLGPDEDTREKGLEALQAIRERVGSKFVADTLAGAETEKQQLKDAREAYFELLQQYVRSSDVPLAERKDLRDEVLGYLKASGQYESLVGGGFLEIQGQEEPSVHEYAERAAILRVKMDQVLRSRRLEPSSSELGQLMADLEIQHKSLKEAVESIAGLEKKILHEAKVLL